MLVCRVFLKEIQARDARDTQRSVAPLKPADDAITLDTTRLSIPEVVDRLTELLAQRGMADGILILPLRRFLERCHDVAGRQPHLSEPGQV